MRLEPLRPIQIYSHEATENPTLPPGVPQIPTDRPDEMLGEHYRIERELGHGGMATVYLCTDVRDGSPAAVKILRIELGSVVSNQRFAREIAFVSELDHPRIPRVLDTGTAGGLPFYAMNFIEGESLRQRLDRKPRLSIDEVRRITAAIAAPMSYAHNRNIVHRDIKPENILLSGDDVYVLDFGVARAMAGATGDRLTATGITLGTPAYMSPEQVSAERDLDLRSDIYSLGCVVYEMLAGIPPFSGNSPHLLMAARFSRPAQALGVLRDDIPEAMEQAVDKAMARFPDDRWQTVDEFVYAMRPPPSAAAPSDAQLPSIQNDLLEQLKNTFADLYTVESEMKGGGMSRLFLATDVALRRRVVIKILPPDLVSPMMLARFRRESEVTAQLQHPHILPVISAGVKDGLVHYVMPFIEGESLRGLLQREKQLPIAYALRILREMTDALAYAHKAGVIHRDIKPENVLIQDGHAVLADFGIAAALTGGGTEPGERLTGTGISLGTVGYMAPEQALGEKTVDARADIYAMGVVGFELFSGVPPFTGATDQAILIAHLTREAPAVDAIRVDTPEAVSNAIKRAMQKDPALRFQDAGEFRDAIDVAYQPTSAGTQGLTASRTALQIRKYKRLPKNWRIALPVAVILVIAAVTATFMKLRGPKDAPNGVVIAIAPFNVPTSDFKLWREGMVDVLARYLDGIGPLKTVSPTIAIKGFPDLADSGSALALGKRTQAIYVIWGTVAGVQGKVALRTHVLEVATGKSWEPGDVVGVTVEDASRNYAKAVLDYLGSKYTLGATKNVSFGSSSIDAIRSFLRGEQYFRATAWDSAGLNYADAIKADSTFPLALYRAAQVAAWQKNGSDSTARALWLKAGARNHHLAARDSLLLTSDSLRAALAPLRSDSMNWAMLTRLFQTVDKAAAKYPDDPEVWYAVGEARFHHGYGSPVAITERDALDAFNKSIALDSAFAPAYVHAIELAFTLDGTEAGKKYVALYLGLHPTDVEAEGIAIVDKVVNDPASVDKLATQAPTDAVMAAYFALRRWPDTGETALKLLQSYKARPRNAQFAADSLRFWNFLPLELAYRGHLAEAWHLMGEKPRASRLFVELALLGGIPADTANSVMTGWISTGLQQSYCALPWFAKRGDIASIMTLSHRADSAARVGTELARRGARYRVASTKAYLSLAKHDTAAARGEFEALPDTLCIACYMDRLEAARLLAAAGKDDAAANLLDQRLNSLIDPTEVSMAMERGRIAFKKKDKAIALRAFGIVAHAWEHGDASIQPMVKEARDALARLGGAALH